MSLRTWAATAALAVALQLPAAAMAEEGTAAKTPDGGSVSLSVGVDWTTQYFFRGIVQETKSLIMQPYIQAGWTVFKSTGTLSSVGLSAGVWNSLHTGPTGSDAADGVVSANGPRAWYEADLYAGMSIGLAELVSLGLTYTAYTSPNGIFGVTHELAPSISLDDSSFFSGMMGGRFGGFQPSVTVAVELKGGAVGDKGTYVGLGLEPGVSIYEGSAASVSAAIPLTLGLGAGDYYDDGAGNTNAFGYFSAAAKVGLGLGFIPAALGSWELAATGQLLVLGDQMKQLNSGDGTEFIFTMGLSNSI